MNMIFLKRVSSLLYFTIVMFVLGDVLRKIGIYFELDFIRYTAIFKTIVLISYIIFISYNFKEYNKIKVTKKFIVFFGLLLVVFFLGQIIIKSNTSLISLLRGNLLFLSRYMYWPFTIIVFFPLISSDHYTNQHLRFFSYIFFTNIFFILWGFFFDFSLFKTYINGNRFGFMGLYNTSNQVSYYFILFMLYYYYRFYFKFKNGLEFCLTLTISFLIGTKKVYFFLFLLFFYHFFKFKLYKNYKFYTISTSSFVLIFMFYSNIKLFLISKFQIFFDIYNESGLITSIFSFRDHLMIITFNDLIVESWRLPNYILGGPKFHEIRSEFGLLDLYVFFGFFGLYVFFYFFKVFYQYTDYSRFYLFILVSVGLTAFFSSGFLSDANQPILFVLISGYFMAQANKDRKAGRGL